MIEKNKNEFQQSFSDTDKNLKKQKMFERIKTIQSLPDEVVENFLRSKGKIKPKISSLNFLPDEK